LRGGDHQRSESKAPTSRFEEIANLSFKENRRTKENRAACGPRGSHAALYLAY